MFHSDFKCTSKRLDVCLQGDVVFYRLSPKDGMADLTCDLYGVTERDFAPLFNARTAKG